MSQLLSREYCKQGYIKAFGSEPLEMDDLTDEQYAREYLDDMSLLSEPVCQFMDS